MTLWWIEPFPIWPHPDEDLASLVNHPRPPRVQHGGGETTPRQPQPPWPSQGRGQR